jgi:hypothetical protein
MNVLSDEELIECRWRAFVHGASAIITICAAAALYLWLTHPAPEPIGVPEIVRQTPSQTVAKIPTLHAGVRVDCTVTIDQAKNVWSITC